jgi:DNA repair exonuclease SbcCD ATPase subunit
MALQDLVASRATKPIDLYIADEVDLALDQNGLERLMTILEQKAKQCGTVLVVSHNSLRDWIDQTITVVKRGGVSHVLSDL